MNKLVSGAIGIEVKLKAGSPRISFSEVPELRNKRIKHIDFIYSTMCTKTPDGNDIIEFGQDSIFITLTERNSQKQLVVDLPVSELNHSSNRLFINKIIDFQRSFINVSGVDPNYVNNHSAYFVFWYDEPAVWNVVNSNDKTSIQAFEIKLKGAKTFFAENRNLYNKRIQNLLVSLPSVTAVGNAGIGNVQNKYLTLKRGSLEFFQRVPVALFEQSRSIYPLRLQNIRFDMQTSYIETPTTTADDLKTIYFNAIIDDTK